MSRRDCVSAAGVFDVPESIEDEADALQRVHALLRLGLG